MPKTAYANRQNELLELVDDFPEYLVSFEEFSNGSYAIELVDYETGETFRL